MKKFVLVLLLLISAKSAKCKHIFGQKIKLLPGRLVPRFDYIHSCTNVSQTVLFRYVKFDLIGDTNVLVVNAEIEFRRLVPTITKTVSQIQNCDDATSGNCQHFQTWQFNKESCTLLEATNEFWSPMFRNVKPDIHCPIQAGNYSLQNGTLDMGLLMRLPFPLERYYWRNRVKGYDPKLFNCLEIGSHFLRQRH